MKAHYFRVAVLYVYFLSHYLLKCQPRERERKKDGWCSDVSVIYCVSTITDMLYLYLSIAALQHGIPRVHVIFPAVIEVQNTEVT